MFLGETFSLAYVVHDVLAPFLRTGGPVYRRRLHFPAAPLATGGVLEGAPVVTPSGALLEHLLRLYHIHFHPAFPILERARWATLRLAVNESQLVWNGILMVAVNLCEESTLLTAGFADRRSARAMFYKKARSLYDGDTETDPLNVMRGTFLLSFWWGEPNELKDSKYWLGIATTLAHARGLHRT